MKRASKTFSVIIAVPSETAARAIANGCRSVGKPGKGSVETSKARSLRWVRTVKPSSSGSTSAPAETSLSRTRSRWPVTPPLMCRSPPAIAVAKTHVPATIRSVTVRCSTGCSRSTPSITRVEVVIPSIWAPIATSIWHRSVISGSRATLSITVLPEASTAAISRFSVAPTEGKSSHRFAPRSWSGTSATT